MNATTHNFQPGDLVRYTYNDDGSFVVGVLVDAIDARSGKAELALRAHTQFDANGGKSIDHTVVFPREFFEQVVRPELKLIAPADCHG